ncbi:MAG: hypothetical protein DWQ06_05115 [Calditrichaeota bacterium]|nr:MAG: hypothetical protein DWQ06_05115 [Calditrichota bacterium]
MKGSIIKKKINSLSWRFRYQILLIFRYLIVKQEAPNLLNRKSIKSCCDEILIVLRNNDLAFEIFKKATLFLQSKELGLDFNNRKTVEKKQTTEQILESLQKELHIKDAHIPKNSGQLKMF